MPSSSAARDYRSGQGYQKSVAYDLSHFEVPEHSGELRRRERLRVVTTPLSQRLFGSRAALAKAVAALALLISLISFSLYSRAVLASINEDINAKTSELNTLNSEYTRLQTELESKISLRNIEEYATANLGMMKIDQSQVQYLNTGEAETVTLYNTSKENTLSAKIKRWISEFMVITGLNIK